MTSVPSEPQERVGPPRIDGDSVPPSSAGVKFFQQLNLYSNLFTSKVIIAKKKNYNSSLSELALEVGEGPRAHRLGNISHAFL